MLPAVFTRTIIHGLDWVAARVLPADPRPRHQRTGTHGEEDAYFYLRKLGYAIVARNFRSPRWRGELRLIGAGAAAPAHRHARRRRRILLPAEARLCDCGAQLSLAAWSRRDRPDWLGCGCSWSY